MSDSLIETITAPDPRAYQRWRDSNPQWQPIEEYKGGDVLFRFGENLDGVVYGERDANGEWVYHFDGMTISLGEFRETFGGIEVVQPARVPTHFCEITPDAAIHFMAL